MTAEYHPLEGVGHNVWWGDYKEQIITWMANFFYLYVMDPPPVGGAVWHPQVARVPARHTSAEDGALGLCAIAVGGLLLPAVARRIARRRGASDR